MSTGRFAPAPRPCRPTALLLAVLLVLLPAAARAEGLFLDERFADLERWQPLTFPKIARHSTYTVDQCDGAPCLRMESRNAASGLVTLRWESQPGATYVIAYSTDLADWSGRVAGSVASGGTTTEHTFATPVAGSNAVFFRVLRQ